MTQQLAVVDHLRREGGGEREDREDDLLVAFVGGQGADADHTREDQREHRQHERHNEAKRFACSGTLH